MPGVNCSVYNCGIPSAKDDAHRRWRDEWLAEIKKTRDFIRQINDNKIYTYEKHFDPEEIEICMYRVMNSLTIRIDSQFHVRVETLEEGRIERDHECM